MSKGPDFLGYGSYGPVPDNDRPLENPPGGNHYEDAWHHRAPGGTLNERPSDYWLDCMVYPDRQQPMNDAQEARQYERSINLRISAGNATGQASGPSDEDK